MFPEFNPEVADWMSNTYDSTTPSLTFQASFQSTPTDFTPSSELGPEWHEITQSPNHHDKTWYETDMNMETDTDVGTPFADPFAGSHNPALLSMGAWIHDETAAFLP